MMLSSVSASPALALLESDEVACTCITLCMRLHKRRAPNEMPVDERQAQKRSPLAESHRQHGFAGVILQLGQCGMV